MPNIDSFSEVNLCGRQDVQIQQLPTLSCGRPISRQIIAQSFYLTETALQCSYS